MLRDRRRSVKGRDIRLIGYVSSAALKRPANALQRYPGVTRSDATLSGCWIIPRYNSTLANIGHKMDYQVVAREKPPGRCDDAGAVSPSLRGFLPSRAARTLPDIRTRIKPMRRRLKWSSRRTSDQNEKPPATTPRGRVRRSASLSGSVPWQSPMTGSHVRTGGPAAEVLSCTSSVPACPASGRPARGCCRR
jgi:hypothetical protein